MEFQAATFADIHSNIVVFSGMFWLLWLIATSLAISVNIISLFKAEQDFLQSI